MSDPSVTAVRRDANPEAIDRNENGGRMTQRGYEALVILKAAGTEDDLSKHAAKLDTQIKKLGGSIESSQHMGRRRLAFPISRHTEGHYYLLRFNAPTGQIGELERLFRLNELIVRFIILTQDEAAPLSSDAAARTSS